MLSLFTVSAVMAQSTINYTIDDGLPSNMVYCVEQDDRGFIWFGTDTGVSRFDGVEFRNFGLEDGLPDIEIINFFKDPQGRIWLYTINGKVGFIKGDSIYSSNNLPILKELDGSSITTNIIEYDSQIYFSNRKEVLRSFDEYQVYKLDSLPLSSGLNECGYVFEAYNSLYLYHHSIFRMNSSNESTNWIEEGKIKLDKFPLPFDHFSKKEKTIFLIQLGGNNLMYYDHSDRSMFYYQLDQFEIELVYNLKKVGSDYLVFTDKGILKYDWESNSYAMWNNSIQGVINAYVDRFGGYWFTTISGGVYLKTSDEIVSEVGIYEPTKIRSNGELLYIGTSEGKLYKYSKNAEISLEYSFVSRIPIETIYFDKAGNLFYNTLSATRYKDQTYQRANLLISEVDNVTYAATKSGAFYYYENGNLLNFLNQQKDMFQIADFGTIYALCAIRKDSILLSNQNGLQVYSNNQLRNLSLSKPEFKNRIIHIEPEKESRVWFLTENKGVLQLGDSTVIRIDETEGLSSNITSSMLITDSLLWVGTRNGLNRININDVDSPVLQIQEENGLPSGNIRGLEFFNDSIFVLTPKGVSKFSVTTDFREDPPIPVILRAVRVDQKEQIISSNYTFSYENKEVEFLYSAINYGLQEGLIYRFQLKNMDNQIDNWNETTQREASFYNLRPGKYIFEIQAKTKNSDWSKKTQVFVEIQSPYWQTLWFQAAALLVIITFSYIGFRISRKRRDEKEKLEKDRIGAEIKALKAQINPHFLFNALSSIQHFMVEDERDAAEDYLSQYSRLIRKVLDHSERLLVSLYEEIETLKLYVKIERLRTNNKFDAQFIVDDSVDEYVTNVPSMVIQPFIENSIWHGVKSLSTQGLVKIKFYISSEVLHIVISDNGVGFNMGEAYLDKADSFGTKLVEDRIKLLKRYYKKEFSFSVSSKVGEGTVVRMKFPANL